jgi:tRNA pseudouridine13 synthase
MAAGRHGEGISLLSSGRDVEKKVAKEVSRHPGEWVRALRRVPLKLRRLYVQAYESYIFNMTLSRALAVGEDISRLQTGDNWAETIEGGLVTLAPRGVGDTPTEGAVPMVQLVGYAFRDYGSRFDALIKEILEAEGVSPGWFYVKEMQEVSVEGGFRRPHLALCDASWSMEGSTARLEFSLAKGQYATVLLREILKPKDPAASGLA